MHRHTRTARERIGRTLAAALSGALAAGITVSALTHAQDPDPTSASTSTAAVATVAARSSSNPATPRDFTGYGFDQCLAPSQRAMDAWLHSSPFWAVGIYISGKSRGCRSQPNLTPAWVRTQLANRWRLLPITLGPQASCSTRFPRYGNDPTISPDPSDNYARARAMGKAEADDAVGAAQALGIVRGSTLWYDLEAFDIRQERCRESALRFVSAWTTRLHKLGYVSGYYSSAATGIRMIDDARVNRPGAFALPDRIWIADWDGKANVESKHIRSDGWKPRKRMKQYRGDHNETWGGVTINIDSNFIDLGRGSVARKHVTFCGGLGMDLSRWPTLRDGASGRMVKRLQCLLQRQGYYDGALTGTMDARTRAAVRAMRVDRGIPAGTVAGQRVWVSLHSAGRTHLMKYGAAGEMVRRLQRALNAAYPGAVPVTGSFAGGTTTAVKRYQGTLGIARTGVVTPELWTRLQAGRL
jgi:peptidoglycan hydrolase-like protein with peptidoglycan-binding domain